MINLNSSVFPGAFQKLLTILSTTRTKKFAYNNNNWINCPISPDSSSKSRQIDNCKFSVVCISARGIKTWKVAGIFISQGTACTKCKFIFVNGCTSFPELKFHQWNNLKFKNIYNIDYLTIIRQ